MYARFRSRSVFYTRKPQLNPAYGVRPNAMRTLNVKAELRKGNTVDEKVSMTDKNRLELLESIRHPRERDFYQDHTYHNQWLARELEMSQKRELSSRYRFMQPGYAIEPWVWFPGDVVEVVDGESRGQRGSIIAVVKYKNELLVQNVNVQDVIIPATETRPEQTVQREHPISVKRVRHVDPQTNEVCDVRLVTVRNKETGALEEKRISLSSGVLMPIPKRDENIEVGDPLKDTPIQDADEVTYDPKAELSVLIERKLRAMEDHFVGRLKEAHQYHSKLAAKNEEDMRRFQVDVVNKAAASAVESLFTSMAAEWWSEEVTPIVEDMQAAEEERRAAASAAGNATQNGTASAAADASSQGDEDMTESDDEVLESSDDKTLENDEDAPGDGQKGEDDRR